MDFIKMTSIIRTAPGKPQCALTFPLHLHGDLCGAHCIIIPFQKKRDQGLQRSRGLPLTTQPDPAIVRIPSKTCG